MNNTCDFYTMPFYEQYSTFRFHPYCNCRVKTLHDLWNFKYFIKKTSFAYQFQASTLIGLLIEFIVYTLYHNRIDKGMLQIQRHWDFDRSIIVIRMDIKIFYRLVCKYPSLICLQICEECIPKSICGNTLYIIWKWTNFVAVVLFVFMTHLTFTNFLFLLPIRRVNHPGNGK